MDRRDLFKIAAVTAGESALAQHHADSKPFDPKALLPRVFTAGEYSLLDALCETILPADSDSGGAHDAGVRYFIDTQAVHAPAAVQEFWRSGLAAIQSLSAEMYQRPFIELTQSERDLLMERMLASEKSPLTSLDRFAVRLKAITIEAFSVSPVGMKHFHYEGNRARFDFPGCTHPPAHTPK